MKQVKSYCILENTIENQWGGPDREAGFRALLRYRVESMGRPGPQNQGHGISPLVKIIQKTVNLLP